MAKGDLFSTVLRGFHKDQVSQYLNDLIRKYEREKEELNKKYEGISPEAMETLRRENARLRQELEKEKARAAELGAQNGQPAPKAQEDPDLEKLRLLASQIKSRMEEARQMEQAARRESERIIAAARLEGQTILNKAKEAGNEGESALGAPAPGAGSGSRTDFKREKRRAGSAGTGARGCGCAACHGSSGTGGNPGKRTAAISRNSSKSPDGSGGDPPAGGDGKNTANGTDAR